MKLKLYKDGYINTQSIVAITIGMQLNGKFCICCHACNDGHYDIEDDIPTKEQAWAKLHEIKRTLEMNYE